MKNRDNRDDIIKAIIGILIFVLVLMYIVNMDMSTEIGVDVYESAIMESNDIIETEEEIPAN